MTTTTRPGSRVARYDLYSAPHRALRLLMSETLARIGRLDVNDRPELTSVLDQLDIVLRLSRLHLTLENQHVHPAIEARQPGATRTIGEEHVEQLDAIDALLAEARALRVGPTTPGALRLYQQLARSIAHAFDHMHLEETTLNPLLWIHYRDEELLEIEQRIADATAAADRLLWLRWMLPALTPIERAWRCAHLQRTLEPTAYDAVLETAQSVLDGRAWNKLKSALGPPADAAGAPTAA